MKRFKGIRDRLAEWRQGKFSNRRRYTRYECEIPVEVHVDSPGHLAILTAVACNISAGGMLIKCETLPESMTPCHISFHVPEWFPFARAERDAMAYAHVRHTSPMNSTFGVAFSSPL